jgi:hypothetical protein
MSNFARVHGERGRAVEGLRDPERAMLAGLLGELGSSIDRLLGTSGAGHAGERSRTETWGLPILRMVHGQEPGPIEPELDPRAPLGHAFPAIESLIGLAPGQSLDVLEELADLGLLQRELFNVVQACPKCDRGLINLRQVCPACGELDLAVESVLHHFACAWIGLESEFTQGFSLRCPKCRAELHQMGQDFERPNETYVCNRCAHTCEDPRLQAQCLHCGEVSPASDLELVRVHSYRATELASRAIELGRLTGLDLADLMVDAELKLDARDFLVIEVRREVARLARHGGAFSAAKLWFEADGRPFELFRRWGPTDRSRLGQILASLRAPLDLVARLDSTALGLLLPGADENGAEVVRERVAAALKEIGLTSESGRALLPMWLSSTWTERDTNPDEVLEFLGLSAGS